jgi:UDP-glucuronate decarboxylase
MLAKPLPIGDLDEVVRQASESFETLRGARIFVSGGTGFFGHWLLESVLHANRVLGSGIKVTVLTRDAERFRTASPWIANDAAIHLVEGDVRGFVFPAEAHTHIIHAATDSGGQQDEQALEDEIVEGTRRVLAFAKQTGARRLLYVSSGAVYGRGITDVSRISESYAGKPSASAGKYDSAKRTAEELCLHSEIEAIVARCFAFVGPRLPLDTHFAIGNFIADAMANRQIHIKGDGTPLRSYLYMSDLAVWLWTMLARAEARSTYNVGSDEAVSIAELAELTAATLRPGLAVQIDSIADPKAPIATYVPSIESARRDLDLRVMVGLSEAIAKTAAWYRN